MLLIYQVFEYISYFKITKCIYIPSTYLFIQNVSVMVGWNETWMQIPGISLGWQPSYDEMISLKPSTEKSHGNLHGRKHGAPVR